MPPKAEHTDDKKTLTADDHLQAMLHLQTAANDRLDTLTHTLNTLVTFLTTQNHHDPPQPPPPPPPQLRPPKIQLPNFSGTNPLEWIFQAENYFTYYNVPQNQRITLAVFYFTGDALIWYKHLATNRLLSTWPEFNQAIEARFGPSTYENHQATLFKLRQTSSVSAYQVEFEKISKCVDDLPTSALRNCFISGLRQDIQSEIAVHNPQTLPETYILAKLIEDKITASRNRYSPFNRAATSTSQTRYTTTTSPSTSTPPSTSPPTHQVRHVCNPPQFLLIADNEDFPHVDVTSPIPPLLTDDPIHTTPPTSPEHPSTTYTPHFLSLSDAAFFGLQSPQALRVTVEGADVILGLAWLSSLGPIIADFSIPQLTFTINNRQCLLKGEPLAAPVSPSSLHILLRKQAIASLHTLIFHHQPPTSSQSPCNDPKFGPSSTLSFGWSN
ncbi:hypothetical protein LXL04_038442 [Taraxacum kok-saghyz]